MLKNRGGSVTPSQVSVEDDGRLRVEVLPGGTCMEPLSGSESSFISGTGPSALGSNFVLSPSCVCKSFGSCSFRPSRPPAARHQNRTREPERRRDRRQRLSRGGGESLWDMSQGQVGRSVSGLILTWFLLRRCTAAASRRGRTPLLFLLVGVWRWASPLTRRSLNYQPVS